MGTGSTMATICTQQRTQSSHEQRSQTKSAQNERGTHGSNVGDEVQGACQCPEQRRHGDAHYVQEEPGAKARQQGDSEFERDVRAELTLDLLHEIHHVRLLE